MVIEQNEGARRANDKMHQNSVEYYNKRIEHKLDEIIELLKKLLEQHRNNARF